jgi:hypothetical protein
MSSNNQIQLNTAGQIALASAASLACNGTTHPLDTIQTCLQTRSSIPLMTHYPHLRIPLLGMARKFDPPLRVPVVGLFRGFSAIYAVDSCSFALAYVTNDVFKKHLGPIGSIFAAAAISTPFIAVGEGAVRNRQANNLSYWDKELWRRSVRLSGVTATLARELLWNYGVFYLTPLMTKKLQNKNNQLSSLACQTLAGAATGSLVGLVSTPIAGIKTVIQTSKDDLSIAKAMRTIVKPETPLNDQWLVRTAKNIQKRWNPTKPKSHCLDALRCTERLFAGVVPRVGYLSLSMCVTHLVYQGLPEYFPKALKDGSQT